VRSPDFSRVIRRKRGVPQTSMKREKRQNKLGELRLFASSDFTERKRGRCGSRILILTDVRKRERNYLSHQHNEEIPIHQRRTGRAVTFSIVKIKNVKRPRKALCCGVEKENNLILAEVRKKIKDI